MLILASAWIWHSMFFWKKLTRIKLGVLAFFVPLYVKPCCCRLKWVYPGAAAFISKTEKPFGFASYHLCIIAIKLERGPNRKSNRVICQWCLGGSKLSFEAFLSGGGERRLLCYSQRGWLCKWGNVASSFMLLYGILVVIVVCLWFRQTFEDHKE